MAKRHVHWTPARLRKLIKASGLPSDAAFARLVRVTPSLVSDWLAGRRQPQPVMELALDCLAVRFGLNASPGYYRSE